MDGATWQRVQQIVADAADLPGPDQAAFIEQACGGDADLLKEVRSLLQAHDSADTFLEASPLREQRDDDTPATIGPYRIERRLGAGGMGVVYLAEQPQPRRMVALKVLPTQVLHAAARRRFAREAEILGRLQHPGLAQVYEAGQASADGYAYLAMEPINGPPLTEFVTERDLSLTDRLQLLEQVCRAVHYAHQKGVIHRDLKPANILVQIHDDGSYQPKVLDFGIAQLMDEQLDLTRTNDQGMSGTPIYMAPEQLSGAVGEADTRGDVYALGVIAYEMLSGQLPHDVRGTSLGEVIRRVTTEPIRPLGRVAPRLRGDVETVVNKALARDPEQRYDSVQAFGDDLLRTVRREPIAARPPGTLYQLRLFAIRHRTLVAGVLLAAFGLVAGAGFAVWQAIEARYERDRAVLAEQQSERRREEAERQTAVATAVQAFLGETLAFANPTVTERPDMTMREMLDAAGQRISTQFAEQPEVAAAVHVSVGDSYRGLGLFAEAELHLRLALERHSTLETRLALAQLLQLRDRLDEALAEVQAIEATVPEDQGLLRADALSLRGVILMRQGKHDLSREAANAALALYTTEVGGSSAQVATVRNLQAETAFALGNYAEAEEMFLVVHALRRELYGQDDYRVGQTEHDLGRLYLQMGRYADAERSLKRSIEITSRVYGESHLEVAAVQQQLGRVYTVMARYTEARPILQGALKILREALGSRHAAVSNVLTALGTLAQEEGYANSDRARMEEAIGYFAEASEIDRVVFGAENLQTANNLNNMSLLQSLLQQSDEAERGFREVLQILRSNYDGAHPHIAVALNNLAGVKMDQGDLGVAADLLQEALAMRSELLAADHPELAEARNNLAWVLRLADRREEALPLFEEARASLVALEQTDVELLDRVRYNLATTLAELGQWERAVEAWRASYEMRSKRETPNPLTLADARGRLGAALLESGQREEGLGHLEAACAVCVDENAGRAICRYLLQTLARVRRTLGDEAGAAELLERLTPDESD